MRTLTRAGLAATLALTLLPAAASAAPSTWVRTTGQAAFGSTPLSGLTCTSPGACIGVGRLGTYPSPAILRDTNGSWTAEGSDEQQADLTDVTCLDTNTCVAAGYRIRELSNGLNGYYTYIRTWDGSTWTTSVTPNPGDTYNQLFGVTCVDGSTPLPADAGGAATCFAVGYWSNTSGNDRTRHPLLLQGVRYTPNGQWHWLQMNMPSPGTTNNLLYDVTCASPTLCVAVGHAETFFTADSFSGAMALKGVKDNGGMWTWSLLPTGKNGSYLQGVSCPTDAGCIAVGTVGTGGRFDKADVETWDMGAGGFVPAANPPAPPAGGGNDLNDIACVSPANCTAVGSTYGPAPDEQSAPPAPVALIQQFDGTSWTEAPIAGPVVPNSTLRAVVCDVPSNSCIADGNDGPDAVVVSGGGVQPPPAPPSDVGQPTTPTTTTPTPTTTTATTSTDTTPVVATPVVAAQAAAPRVCHSRRNFPIHLTVPKGLRAGQITMVVAGRQARQLAVHGRGVRAVVDLRGRLKSTITVELTIRAHGKVVHQTRTYHTCVARGAGR